MNMMLMMMSHIVVPDQSPIHPQSFPAMAVEEKQESYTTHLAAVPNAADWLLGKLVSIQSDIVYSCIVSLLAPFLTLYSIASDSYRRTEEMLTSAAGSAFGKAPHKLTHRPYLMMRKIGLGVVGMIHVSFVLTMVMALAVVLGVGIIRILAEEPVFSSHKLQFDYTDPNPVALLHLGKNAQAPAGAIPVGHTFRVSLDLLVPESDYNRQIGVFQVSAEVLSATGDVMARSSRPCMLKFRSLQVRVARSFLMGVPLLLGMSDETQKLSLQQLVKHKELYHSRTAAIRVTLSSRAGTQSYLPQLYEAEMVINSQLPWSKALVLRWKWTFCVWTSLYIYIALVAALVSCCRTLLFPIPTRDGNEELEEAEAEPRSRNERETTTSEMMGKWQMRTRKRKASSYLYGEPGEPESSSVSSITMSCCRDDGASSTLAEEEIGDSTK